MKKIITALIMVCFVTLQACLPATAADEAKISAAYGIEDTLYAFVNGAENFENASLSADNTAVSDSSIKSVKEAGVKIRYIFVLDESKLMGESKRDVENFIQSVVDSDETGALYTLRYFGEEYHYIPDQQPDDIDSGNLFLSSLKNMTVYQYDYADPYKALYVTLNDLNSSFPKYKEGEMTNVVLISKRDYYDEGTSISMSELESKIKSCTNIVVHTYCLGEHNGARYESLSCGSGLNLKFSETAPEEAGKEIAGFVNGTKLVSGSAAGLSESKGVFPVSVMLSQNDGGMQIVQIENVRANSYNESKAEAEEDMQENANEGEALPEETENDVETEEETAISDKAEGEKPAAEETETEMNEEKQEQKSGGLFVMVICAVIVLIIAITAAAVYILKRKQKQAGSGFKIYMRIEMISGECLNKSLEFYLTDKLIIGSSRNCDIRIRGIGVSPENSKIFIENNMIYIEDLNSESGTYLGGMQIYGKNRLRSTDEITIGSVHFIIKF